MKIHQTKILIIVHFLYIIYFFSQLLYKFVFVVKTNIKISYIKKVRCLRNV